MAKLFVLLISLFSISYAAHYAVLAAGSNGYWNYRHQADVCHAYQILISHGVPADNIITLAYDDIANNHSNPFPGALYNKPGTNPPNVYDGCVIDYKGSACNSANFLAILKGDKQGVTGGNGRVLESGVNDHVFINFVDHGAPGLIAFGNERLYADTLIDTLSQMNESKKYAKLVFYLEACESGSMFNDNKLPANTSIYAETAASPDQSSWGTYCPPQDKVNGKSLNTCLGDLYSVNWMENSDKDNLSTETIDQQYTDVKKLTTKSIVEQYGDMALLPLPVGQFLGNDTVTPGYDNSEFVTPEHHVDSRDAKLDYLYHSYKNTKSKDMFRQLIDELMERQFSDNVFEEFDRRYNIKE